jgi:hypothetical protein
MLEVPIVIERPVPTIPLTYVKSLSLGINYRINREVQCSRRTPASASTAFTSR